LLGTGVNNDMGVPVAGDVDSFRPQIELGDSFLQIQRVNFEISIVETDNHVCIEFFL
jgi:hypothetical protein